MQSRPIIEEDPTLGLCQLTVAFDRGSLVDPPGREGATLLLLRMMRRSHPKMDSEGLEATWDRLGASLNVEATRTVAAFHLTVLSRNLIEAVKLLSEMLSHSQFCQREFELLKQEALDDWIESLDDDATVARRAFSRAFFRGHPYERPTAGSYDTIAALTLHDLESARQRIIARDRTHLALAGTAPSELDLLLGDLVANLPSRAPEWAPPPDHVLPDGIRVLFVDKPQRAQAQILMGGLGTKASDADMVDLHIAHTAFGGTFAARLSEELRVKRGWTYGAYSHLPVDHVRQPFWCSTAARLEDAAPCVELMLQMLERLVSRGLTSTELRATKKYLQNSHAFALDTAVKRAGAQLDQRLHGHLAASEYISRVRAATTESVQAALARRLSSRDLVLTVLGTSGPLVEALRVHDAALAIQPFDIRSL